MRWPLGLAMMAVTGMCATTSYPDPDDDRACWQDEDCKRYPLCRTRTLSCRCQLKGSCLLARGYRQRCLEDTHCAIGMMCSEEGVCMCEDGSRYSKYTSLCIIVPNQVEPPRFADLPDEEDPDAPPQIPATYGGPLLVGIIGMGLVVLCLGTALWCRCTSPRSPIGQSPPSYCTEREREKIPLDLFYLPPPEKYQTPGYHNNYHSIGDGSLASTSKAGPVTTRLVHHDLSRKHLCHRSNE